MYAKLSNVPLRDFQTFLKKVGCTRLTIKGGHEKWTRADLARPIILQTHIDIVPEFIIRNALRTLKLSRTEFLQKLFE